MKLYYAPGCLLAGPAHRTERDRPAVRAGQGRPGEAHAAGRLGLPCRSIRRATSRSSQLDDGTYLSEASVILQYIADQKPGTIAPVFGTAARWKVMEWLAFISTEVHKGFGPLWNPQTPPDVRERAVQALANRFTLIAKTLASQPYLTGQDFTIADAYLFVVLNWSKLLKVDLTPWPALTAFQQRVAARPAVQKTLKAEGLLK